MADRVHYPGTYLAGGYNRLQTEIAGRVVENEDLVNLPNWLAVGVRLADADWFDERHVTLLEYRQELDLRRGMLLRTVRFEEQGRRSTLRERRLVSMHDMHLAALEVSVTTADGQPVEGAQVGFVERSETGQPDQERLVLTLQSEGLPAGDYLLVANLTDQTSATARTSIPFVVMAGNGPG